MNTTVANPFESRVSRSSMNEHTTPLTVEEARHLMSRLAFGAPIGTITGLVGSTAGDVVDQMLDAAAEPLPPDPEWLSVQRPPRGSSDAAFDEFNSNNRIWLDNVRSDWILDMAANGLRGRLSLFWHNHFVTSHVNYRYAALGHNYLKLIQLNAQQNFKTFAHAIGRDPAMLIYLDGDSNRASAPNENYARELMELFTMGPYAADGSPNYSENDVQEVARAMTGWRLTVSSTWSSYFVFNRYDDGEKTIFGRTGEFNYNDVIDIIFEERSSEIAYFIAKSLYTEFIYHEPDEESILVLAQTFQDSNFELRPVLRQLFTSQRFLDPNFAGSRIKSPVEHLLGHYVELGIEPTQDQAKQVWRAASGVGQNILDPPNVAGWPGQRYWLTTDTLPERWSESDFVLGNVIAGVFMANFGEALVGPTSTHPALEVAVAMAEHLFKIPLEWVEVPNISEPFEGDLIANPLPAWLVDGPEYQRNLAKLFLGSLPWYEYEIRANQGPQFISAYMTRLSQFPEFQLI